MTLSHLFIFNSISSDQNHSSAVSFPPRKRKECPFLRLIYALKIYGATMKQRLINAMFGVGFAFLMTDLLLFPISQTVFVHSLKRMTLHVLQSCEMVCLQLLDLVLGNYRLKAKLHKCTRFVPCNSSLSLVQL